jgi:hypothetical protein
MVLEEVKAEEAMGMRVGEMGVRGEGCRIRNDR